MACDPYFNSVSLLLHGDGSDNGTTFTDSSSNNFTATRNGNTVTKTATKKFGTASIYFDGTDDYLTFADNAAWDLGGGDFTLECWYHPTGYPANNGGAYIHTLLCQDMTTSRAWLWSVSGTASSLTGMGFQGCADNVPNSTSVSCSYTFSLNTWYHLATCRNGNNLYHFVNGVLCGGGSFSRTIQNCTDVLKVGSYHWNGGTYNWDMVGYLDDVRITKGIARYTSNFVIPSAAYPDTPCAISGSLTESLATTDWRFSALDMAAPVLKGTTTTTGSSYTATPISTYNPIAITAQQKIDYAWQPYKVAAVGDYCVPTDIVSKPYLYKCTSNSDSYWANDVAMYNGRMADLASLSRSVSAQGSATRVTSATIAQIEGDYCYYFDGAGDYITVSNFPSLTGSTDFTIEYYIRFIDGSASSSYMRTLSIGTSEVAGAICGLCWSTNNPAEHYFTLFGPTTTIGYSTGLANGEWHHIALVRKNYIYTLFHNGVEAFSQNHIYDSRNITGTTAYLGANNGGAAQWFKGYLDFVRVSQVARYTSKWHMSAPSAELALAGDTYSSNVSLLLNCNGTNGGTTFTDSSSNAFTVTASGNVNTSTTQKKFGTASAYFDGTGDYLSVADNAAFELGQGDFTLECWYYPTGWPTGDAGNYNHMLIAKDVSGSRGFNFNVRGTASSLTAVSFTGFSDNANYTSITNSGTYPFALNNWYHIAAVRYQDYVFVYVNGDCIGYGTFTRTIQDTTSPLKIGSNEYDATFKYYVTGYIDDVRITKGVARYVPNTYFTPPTSETVLAGDANSASVVLLLNGNGADDGTTFTDSSNNNFTATVYGNARTRTGVKKFGSASMYFDGTGDYITFPDNDAWDLGSVNWCIECWYYPTGYPNNNNGAYRQAICGQDIAGTRSWMFAVTGTASSFTGLLFEGCADNVPNYTDITGTYRFSLNTWYHIAACRYKNDLYLFVDGVQINLGASQFQRTLPTSTATLRVGALVYGSGYDYYCNGYIDDLRITKGAARYLPTFTPPTFVSPTTGATEPSWTNSGTFTDGGVTWTYQDSLVTPKTLLGAGE